MLNHLELKSTFRGNCVPLEKINVLNCTSENCLEEINMSTVGHREDENTEKEETISETDLDKEWVDQQSIDLRNNPITDVSKQIVGYIAGYVVARLGNELKCNICIQALLGTELLWFHKIIVIKDRGGLCYPTQQVYDICMACEAVIRLAIAISGGKSLNPKYGLEYLATKSLEKLQTISSIREFANHSADVSSLQMDHSLLLINLIIHKYIKVRLYHESKMFNLQNKKNSKRQLYNKLLLHSGI